jgi:hypothetical protein
MKGNEYLEKIKNLLKRGERSDTYLIHLCRLLQSIEALERINKILEPSANTS